MILEAIAATRAHYGDPPALGMVTFIDRSKVRPTIVRGEPVWGWTWLKAGFEVCGETKGGLLALRIPPERMPAPRSALPNAAECRRIEEAQRQGRLAV